MDDSQHQFNCVDLCPSHFILIGHPMCSTLQWLLLSNVCQRPPFPSFGTIVVLVLWCFGEVLSLDGSTFNITRGRWYSMLSLLSLMSIFREDVVHKVDPMLKWEFINPINSLFQAWLIIFSKLIIHTLTLTCISTTYILCFGHDRSL
jgi:hypothetical protein